MSDNEQIKIVLKSIEAKLEILRNYMVIAQDGVRNQQSAANLEIISVFKDISNQLTRVLRGIEK